MQILYTFEEKDNDNQSIFLAGPTLRDYDSGLESWRDQCVDLLKYYNFDGTVFLPEMSLDPDKRQFFEDIMNSKDGYSRRVEWEIKYLNEADIILFWIPRNIKTLPGFTTNIEFGEFMHSRKIVVGFPLIADKCEYIDYRCKKHNIPCYNTLSQCVEYAVERLK